MTAATLAINEVFGPTLQGEGPNLGRRAAFVRVARCNLSCSWCDAHFTWDWTRHDPAAEVHSMAVADVHDQVLALQCRLVVLTGGEPLLQQRGLTALASLLRGSGCEVEVETNGTRPPDPRLSALVRYNVSPKLANSGLAWEQRIRPEVLRTFGQLPGTAVKFVVADPSDLEEVGEVVDVAGVPAGAVWIMPEGTDAATVVRRHAELADLVVDLGWNMTTRLHVLAWGDERGR